MDNKGLQYLQYKLSERRPRALLRYVFYDMKNTTQDLGISTPPALKYWNSVVGWCSKSVDSLADRLVFRGFRDDVFGLNQIYDLNNRDMLLPSAVKAALITSCSFIYISEDESGFPRLQSISGDDATGIIDPVTGMLHEGYAVLERDDFGVPTMEAYFTYDWTAYYQGGQLVDVRENRAPYPLLVPVVFRPDAKRPFGHSRISRACMSHVAGAVRTIKRSEISAEFYSFPQKWATGLEETAKLDKWSSAMSAMMQFTLNEDGQDHVKLGQFSQQTMEPHITQLRTFASLFAGETGLTLDDMGFPTDNPSSAEAIKAAHETLRLTAEAAQRSFGSALLNAGFLGACIRDNYKYQRTQLSVERPYWSPTFPADASMIGAVGDGLGKIAQSFPGYVSEETIFDLTGV